MNPETALWHTCETDYFPRKLNLRSPNTRRQYRYACEDFSEHLQRPAALADLDDDVLTIWTASMLDRKPPLSVYTVRERLGRILTLWTWLAKKGYLGKFPTIQRPEAPDPLPIAPREEELRRLFRSAQKERGAIEGIPADQWWVSHLGFVWCTSERKSASLSVRVKWLDLDQRVCVIPAEYRKGRRKHGIYPLWPSLIPILRSVIAACPNRELVWPWPYDEVTYYNHFRRIAVDAGWPDDRKHKTHALRVGHATHLKIAGGDPTAKLMHGDVATTIRHYIDSRLIPPDENRLFIPWDSTPPPGAG